MTNKKKADFSEIMEEMGLGAPPVQATHVLGSITDYHDWCDYVNRVMYLFDEIDDFTMTYVNYLYRWDREDDLAGIAPEDRKPVTIYIQNFGGDLTVCYAMIAAMKAYKGKIITVNQGVACSAAALIFICGTKGCRYCTKYSFTLLHQGASSGGYGTYSQQESAQKNYKKMINMMEEIILSNTNIDPKTYKKTCGQENYYYADDCIKMGICDKVIDNISDIYETVKTKKVAAKKSTAAKKVKK